MKRKLKNRKGKKRIVKRKAKGQPTATQPFETPYMKLYGSSIGIEF